MNLPASVEALARKRAGEAHLELQGPWPDFSVVLAAAVDDVMVAIDDLPLTDADDAWLLHWEQGGAEADVTRFIQNYLEHT